MKNTTKNTKTILFAFPILAAILSFGIIGFAAGESNATDVQERSAYEKLLLEHGEGLQELSDTEKTAYVNSLREFISSLNGYDAKVFEKINEYAEAKEMLENAEEQGSQDTTQLERNLARLHFELEELGVTTQDRLRSNPEYWIEKINEVKENIARTGTNNVSGFDKETNLHYVDQTDLALKRVASVSVACIPLDFNPFYCTTVATGWNAGSSTATWWFLLYTNYVDFYSSVCLDQSTHHSSVDFEMDTVRKITSVFGTVATSSNNYDLNFDSEGDCSSNELSQWVVATNKVSTTTSISNISLN